MSLYFLKACEMLNTKGYEVAYLIDLFQEVKLITYTYYLTSYSCSSFNLLCSCNYCAITNSLPNPTSPDCQSCIG